MDEGKLPNLKALAEEGVFARLGSTQPSESPTAWSSFATGVNPGKHSIYDFLIRDLETYFPDFNMVKKEPPEFLWGLIPTKAPKITSMRGGTSFWKTASADGDQLRGADRARHLPARGAAPRPDARRPAAARHARHARHLLLLGDRPVVVRGGQHRVRRLPEAAAVRRRGLRDHAQGAREPDPQAGGGRAAGEAQGGAPSPSASRRGSTSSPPART